MKNKYDVVVFNDDDFTQQPVGILAGGVVAFLLVWTM